MKNCFILVCLIFIFCFGCKHSTPNKNYQAVKKEAFTPVLKSKLNELFLKADSCWGPDEYVGINEDKDVYGDVDKSDYNDGKIYNNDGKIYFAKFKKHKRLYRLSFYKEGKHNIVFLHTDYFYNKQKIKGYTFIGDRLVVYDGNYTGQSQNLIDTSKLIQFVDTIPGYDSDEVVDIEYEIIMQKSIIFSSDSLIQTYFGY